MNPDVMIDLETLSDRADSVILTLGAIKFYRNDDLTKSVAAPTSPVHIAENCPSFYRRVDYGAMKEDGFHVSEDTVRWWMRQSEDAKAEAFDPNDRHPIKNVLMDLYMWVGNARCVWSHGTSFDNTIVDHEGRVLDIENKIAAISVAEHQYKANNQRSPWFFTESRCTRTLFDIVGWDSRKQKSMRGKNHHHALFDAWDQAVMVQRAFRQISVSGDV